jgi:Sel1 repeat
MAERQNQISGNSSLEGLQMPTAREQESILICTQCGHINPATNKFCGNCGNGLVSIFEAPPSNTIDNRKVVDSGVVTMPDLTTPPVTPKPEAPAPRPAATEESVPRPRVVAREIPRNMAAEPRVVEPRRIPREETVSPISGPSFLGLNSDPTATADYLLVDEEPRRGGAFRFLMILAIIALVVVGALEWRAIRKMVAEQGARLQSSPSAEQAPPASSSDATPPAATNGQTPATTAAPAANTGSDIQQQHPLVEMDLPAQGQQASQSQPGQSQPAQPNQPAAIPAASQPAPAQPSAQPPAPANPPASESTPQPQAAPQGSSANVKPNTGARIQRASETPGKTLAAASIPAKPVQEPPKEKPDPAKDPNVVAAEKYLYGPSRNCVAARSLLEQAAERQNPSAMSHLGAMYATGECVTANKTLAYIWFSRAYDVNPQNQWLEKNLTMLWRDMSSSERQVVLKAKGRN